MLQVPGSRADGALLNRVGEAVTGDPVLAAVVVLLGAALALLVLLAIRRLFVTEGVTLRRTLAAVDEVVVLMHPNPDPDSMAAAIGVARLAELAGTDAVVQYSGQIRHQENRAFRTVLDLELSRIESADDLAAGPVVLVDHNEPRGFDGAADVRPYAVVDHHPGEGMGSAFTDVRSTYGACSSIVAEYFRHVGARPARDPPDAGPLPSTVATGLLYGILADTSHLTRGCTRAEFEAAAFLYPAVDQEKLDRIANPQVDQEILEVIATAIHQREVRGPYALADVGRLSNLDAIPQAADELLTLEGVTAVVVVGEKNGTLHLSGRSRDDRVHMGNVLQSTLETLPSATGGGHARMGGGRIAVEALGDGTGSVESLTRVEFHERLFDALAGDV